MSHASDGKLTGLKHILFKIKQAFKSIYCGFVYEDELFWICLKTSQDI